MIQNIKKELKLYFENEILDSENGYPERNISWMLENTYPRLEQLINLNKHKNCLDVGCAFGYFTKVLGKKFENTYGIDLSEKRVNLAKKNETNNLKFVCADLTEPLETFFPLKFDFMFSNAVIPHIPLEFKASVFKNLANVANKDCIFVLYDGMLDETNKNKHAGKPQDNFDNWTSNQLIKVVFFSESWLRENAVHWDIASINNVAYATDEIILKRK